MLASPVTPVQETWVERAELQSELGGAGRAENAEEGAGVDGELGVLAVDLRRYDVADMSDMVTGNSAIFSRLQVAAASARPAVVSASTASASAARCSLMAVD